MEEFNLLDMKGFNDHLIATKDAEIGPDGLKTKTEIVLTALKFLAQQKPKLHGKCSRARQEYKEYGSSHFQNKRKFDE